MAWPPARGRQRARSLGAQGCLPSSQGSLAAGTEGESVARVIPAGQRGMGIPVVGLALTHTRLPVLRRPVPAAALTPVAARHVQADGESATLAQPLCALIHI